MLAGFTFFQEMSTNATDNSLNNALSELFRMARTTLHCPESSSLIFHSMGYRHYFVADRLEDLVDEGDSRSSSLFNLEVFCLFLNCMWQSRHLEVDVYLLELGGRTGWLSTHNGSRFISICIFVFVCVFVFL